MINGLVGWLLRSPARRLLDGSLVLLRVRERKSGVWFELPVQYARTDGGLVIIPGNPESKLWWRNLREPSAIEVFIEGAWRTAVGLVVNSADASYAALLASYGERWRSVKVPPSNPVVDVTWTD